MSSKEKLDMGFDLCSELTFSWVMVSLGGSELAWLRPQRRGSLLLLIPTAWILMQGEEALSFTSSSSSLLPFSWICGSNRGLGEGLWDSPSGKTKTGTPFGLIHNPFTPNRGNIWEHISRLEEKLVTWGLGHEVHKTWSKHVKMKGRERKRGGKTLKKKKI